MSGEGIPESVRGAVLSRAAFKYDITKEPDFSVEPRLSRALRDVLIERGHDGVIADLPDGSREVVAFRAEQLKSATGNSGRFDPNSASLTDPLPKVSTEIAVDDLGTRQPPLSEREAAANDAAPPAPETTAPPKPPRPEQLIELRKRESVLSSLLECLAA